MIEDARSPLVAWESFYVIVGSSGAALTGLQFVVIALIAESRARATPRQLDAFSTPTIVHFAAVLFVSALLSAPWGGLTGVSLALGACGVTGVIYGGIVVRRTSRVSTLCLVFEIRFWHAVFPITSYALLLFAAVLLPKYPHRVLFLVGTTALGLLFIGIHNAWDAVTYIAMGGLRPPDEADDQR